MLIIQNMLDKLGRYYTVDGLKLIDDRTKQVEEFKTKEELFWRVLTLYNNLR